MAAYSNDTDYDTSGFDSSHTISSFNCSGTDSHLVVAAYSRNVTTDLSSITANGNTMVARGSSENSSVCGVEFYDYTISNASFDIVGSTPSFKLLGMSAIALTGVDQTTAAIGTPVTNTGFSDTPTASYTGTSGSLLLVAINTQNARTATASNCTEMANFDHSNANLGQCFSGYVAATGSAQTIGATLNSADNWAISIVEMSNAGGAPAPTLVRSAIIM